MPVVVAVIGKKNSGKTTVIETLTTRLSRDGFKVGAVKHVHHKRGIDTPGTDTWRFAKAGARVVVFNSPTELSVVKRTEAPPISLADVMRPVENEDLDVVFLEGFHSLVARESRVYKIVTAATAEDVRATLEGTEPPIIAISGSIAQGKHATPFPVETIDAVKDSDRLAGIIRGLVSEHASH